MSDIEKRILAKIKEGLAREIRIFFPERFNSICTTEEALCVLNALAAEGELETRAQIYSPGGHICFDDELSILTQLTADIGPPWSCCGRELDRNEAVLYFVIPRQKLHPKAEEYIRPREALEKICELADRKELREIHAIACEALAEGPNGPNEGTCKRPPKGWYCTLSAGHDGPCPTWLR